MSPDGLDVYTATSQVTRHLRRDAATGALTEVERLEAPSGESLAITPDGSQLLAAGGSNIPKYPAPDMGPLTVFARNPVTGGIIPVQALVVFPTSIPAGVTDVTLSPDGKFAYVVDRLGARLATVARGADGLWAVRQVVPISDPGNPMPTPRQIVVAPDGKHAYLTVVSRVLVFSVAEDGTLAQHDPNPDDPTAHLPRGLAIAPDGSRLYVAGFKAASLPIDPVTGELGDPLPSGPETPALSGDGGFSGWLTLSPDGISLYGASMGTPNGLGFLAVTPDGLAGRARYRTYVDGARGLDNPRGVAVSPDGRNVYVAGTDSPVSATLGTMAVFTRDTQTGALTYRQLILERESQPSTAELVLGESAKLLINNGAAYTNNPNVELRFTGRVFFKPQVSNDGGLKKTIDLDLDANGVAPWRLQESGPERLPKTVYARVWSVHNGVISDDIVLDQTAPVILATQSASTSRVRARARTRKVKVRARDRTSGVAKVQWQRAGAKAHRWVSYVASRAYAVPSGRVRVRVRDRAGNVSRWRAVGR